VFFAQLLIGLAGVDSLLMTGRLHVPVPAVVIGGPLYRGDRVFMPFLFLATIVLVGPAWCSYLCYFGAWDALAAGRKGRAGALGAAWSRLRYALFVLTPIVALSLRFAGASGGLAAAVAGGFGAIGALCMATLSARRGVMVHCSSLCPLGVASMLLGKVSPFRVRIGETCTDCGRCTKVCRYNALNPEHVRRRRPGANCSLCGDCLGACREGAIDYRFPGLTGSAARWIFLILVVSLHAVFLGVARI
jgi:polyferredoxin